MAENDQPLDPHLYGLSPDEVYPYLKEWHPEGYICPVCSGKDWIMQLDTVSSPVDGSDVHRVLPDQMREAAKPDPRGSVWTRHNSYKRTFSFICGTCYHQVAFNAGFLINRLEARRAKQ